jgi:spore germination protein KA
MRSKVLFSALIEVLIVEFIVELLRESLLRVPSKIGTAIGIVGAIVIGQAATAAGIFSPLLLIIVATSLMASFAIPDYFAAHPIRILKFFMIIMTGLFGFYGFVLAFTLILTNLVSINSFGVPYMAPLAPFNLYDAIRAFFFNRSTSPKRQQILRTKDDTRTGTYHRPKEK